MELKAFVFIFCIISAINGLPVYESSKRDGRQGILEYPKQLAAVLTGVINESLDRLANSNKPTTPAPPKAEIVTLPSAPLAQAPSGNTPTKDPAETFAEEFLQNNYIGKFHPSLTASNPAPVAPSAPLAQAPSGNTPTKDPAETFAEEFLQNNYIGKFHPSLTASNPAPVAPAAPVAPVVSAPAPAAVNPNPNPIVSEAIPESVNNPEPVPNSVAVTEAQKNAENIDGTLIEGGSGFPPKVDADISLLGIATSVKPPKRGPVIDNLELSAFPGGLQQSQSNTLRPSGGVTTEEDDEATTPAGGSVTTDDDAETRASTSDAEASTTDADAEATTSDTADEETTIDADAETTSATEEEEVDEAEDAEEASLNFPDSFA